MADPRKSKETVTMSMKKIAALVLAATAGVLALPASAMANQGIASFEVSTTTTQAGGHPDLGMSFELESPGQPESAQNIAVNTPEGIFGNPNVVFQCTSEDFALDQCPSASQVGYVTIRANSGGDSNKLLGTAPIFSRAPGVDQTALLGFVVPTLNIPVSIPIAVRTASDYGLRFTVAHLTQLAPLARADVTFWAFPADEANDDQRFPKGSPGNAAGCPGLASTACLSGSTDAGITVRPFINNPSRCTGQPLTATVDVQTYQDPDNPSHEETSYPASSGCFNMTFKPVLLGTPTNSEADAPSGLDMQMSAPQPLGGATTPSPIRSAILTLPEGLTINPDAADGQSDCPDALANFDSEAPAECPDKAKIGTFAVGSPALDGPLEGSIFIGEPKSDDQYRLFMIADGFGVHAKFLASFRPDPKTGQITAYIDDLPQAPFETFDLHLFASDRGLMATPTQCRVYEVAANFLPWNDFLPDQRSKQFFSIDSGPGGSSCPGQVRRFNPRLVAGTSDPTAGGFSDFALQLDRDDGDQFLGDLNFTMPPGFTGSLRDISYCSEAAIAVAAQKAGKAELGSPSCPASSQIGTTNVSAGPGSHPFNVAGQIYFAGPFKGAPLSLVAITPALAGPYDYGTQVVRVALHVDTLTAQVRAISDTVPQIISGVPIRLRSIRVSLNRPNFIINPTDCAAKSIDSQGIGDQGTVADFSSYFHAVNCFALPFRPQMKITQLDKSRKKTRRNANPILRFELFTRPGDANIESVAVTLPKAFAIDQRHLGNLCSKAQLASERCKGRQPIGSVETTTPLLDQPLKGPAYAVSGYGVLPHVAFILDGQVTLIPEGESSSTKSGALETVVPVVPDAPIGHFRLDLLGGKQGYLINTKDLCRRPVIAAVHYTAHSGKTLTQKVKAKAPCGKSRKAKRTVRRSRR